MFSKFQCLSGSTLKLIAILLMLIDHIGVVLFPDCILLRIIGRSAFPIFCFLLVEGFLHTRNKWHYAIRLALFAILSQIPFSLVVHNTPFCFSYLNVFFTLLIGFLVLIGIEKVDGQNLPSILIFILGCIISVVLNTDYSAIGIATILIFFTYAKSQKFLTLTLLLLFINSLGGNIQLFAILSLIPIALYNHQRGLKLKYVFYIFYPLHLLILYLISLYL